MKNYIKFSGISALLSLSILLFSCSKDHLPALPEIYDSYVSACGSSSAVISSSVSEEPGYPVTSRGVWWGTSMKPVGCGNMAAGEAFQGENFIVLTSLEPGTDYYATAFAANSEGTVYGETISFRTLNPVFDIDENIYDIVTVGDQTWMQENLYVTKYRNGDPIPSTYLAELFWNTSEGAYSTYNNESADTTYGNFYNWCAVADPRGLCPAGWHVPSDEEWTQLTDYLGGSGVAGGHLKEQGNDHWVVYNIAATNSSGFTALPAGRSGIDGYKYGRGNHAGFWTSSESVPDSAWFHGVTMNEGRAGRYSTDKNYGFSLRCIKD